MFEDDETKELPPRLAYPKPALILGQLNLAGIKYDGAKHSWHVGANVFKYDKLGDALSCWAETRGDDQ